MWLGSGSLKKKKLVLYTIGNMPTICFVKRWGVVLQVEKKKELEVEKTGNKEYYAPPPKKKSVSLLPN